MKPYLERLQNSTVKFEADSKVANGPSSGIGLAAAKISAVPVSNWREVAFTGEI